MNTKEAFSEIIKINKLIIDNDLDKLLPRTKQMQEAYNNSIKPLLNQFKEKNGKTERTFIKEILEKSNYEKINNLKIKTYGNWGRKINPYIWVSIFVENDQNSASNSIQLYLNINSEGIKFGFDYGDKIENNHNSIIEIKKDEAYQNIIIDAINRNDLDVISIEAGSPSILFNHNRRDNLIKTINDFENWNNDIHLIKNYKAEEIPDDIENIIIDVINSFLPLCANLNIDSIKEDVGYWLYSAGSKANDWSNQFDNSFMSIDYDAPDNLKEFSSREELDKMVEEFDIGSYNTSMALWQFANEINIGDVIISKQGRSKYLGYGIVTSEYIFDKSKTEYRHTRKVSWKKSGEWASKDKLPIKTLTNITQYSDYVDRLKHKIGIDSNKSNEIDIEFNVDKVLENVFINKGEFLNIVDILSTKKNIILQGSAGVGKTFIAKKIAQALQEDYREDRIEMIQFHQSYSYEDFIQGYRPNNDSFELKNGVFYEVCEKAKKDTSLPYFLIIDEINRGNLSKIFGELMMLIEADKRGYKNEIKLTYSDSNEGFYVPDNLYIIGTMNTADRSLSMVDYALRRRFAFIKMKPNYDKPFVDFLLKKGLSNEMILDIIDRMSNINSKILSDDSLGDGFEIGHSYFCSFKSGDHRNWINNIYKYEIIPLIEEYWFDDQDLVNQYSNLFK